MFADNLGLRPAYLASLAINFAAKFYAMYQSLGRMVIAPKILNTLLVDLDPQNAATPQAMRSLLRCLLQGHWPVCNWSLQVLAWVRLSHDMQRLQLFASPWLLSKCRTGEMREM